MTAVIDSGVDSVTGADEFTAELVVRDRTQAADGVITLTLADPRGAALPVGQPGAHIDVMLDNGVVRQYSLCGALGDDRAWTVGVLRDPRSRGGSRYIHDHLHPGTRVRVRGPRNHFPLIDSPRYLFVAGGIGITPITAMIHRAERSGARWELVYLGRTRAAMAFTTELSRRYGDKVVVWADDERGGPIDLPDRLGAPVDDTMVYCCGPEGLLAAVEGVGRHWPVGSIRVERFAGRAESATAADRPVEVDCHRSGITVTVDADVPLLDALEDAGIPIMSSCGEGICGTCRTTVLEGTPDHRDSLLTDDEKNSGTVILPCVSRSRTARLVLDL